MFDRAACAFARPDLAPERASDDLIVVKIPKTSSSDDIGSSRRVVICSSHIEHL